MKHRRQSNNGFQMFRLHTRDLLRAKGQRLTEEELIKACAAEWEALTDDAKAEWKCKARGEKFKIRAENVTPTVSQDDSTDGGTSAASASRASVQRPERPVPRPDSSTVRKNASVDNVLKAQEELELLHNPEKRRQIDRDEFQTAFTWKYLTKLDELRSKKFYLFGSSVLHYTSDGDCVPAEVACVEFTIENGPTLCYCSPVALTEGSCLANVEVLIKEISQRSHRFTVEDLSTIGKLPSVIADVIIDMSHERENCLKKRFFISNCEMQTTFNCLRYLMINSNLSPRYKNMTVNNVSAVDDLASALFNMFEVDYPKKPKCPTRVVDFGYFKELIGACEFRRVVCAVHENYDDAVCCLSNLYLIAEIISRSIKRRRFDRDHLTRFVSSGPDIQPNFLVPGEGNTSDHGTVKDGQLDTSLDTQTEVGTITEEQDCSEDEEQRGEIQQNVQSSAQFQILATPVEREGSGFTGIRQTTPSTSLVSSDNPDVGIRKQIVASSVAVPVFLVRDRSSGSPHVEPLVCQHDVTPPSVATGMPKEVVAFGRIEPLPSGYPMSECSAFEWQSFPVQAPDTLSVQQLLPINKRGFGRGLYLQPEAASFLEKLKFVKNSTE